MKSIKCLKQVFKWASSLRLTIFWKWEWYMWAYTRNKRLNIVFTTSLKLAGNGEPERFYSLRNQSEKDDRSYNLRILMEKNIKIFTKLLREYGFIIKLCFNPVHQIFYIFWSRNLNRFFNLYTICPSIFIPKVFQTEYNIRTTDA